MKFTKMQGCGNDYVYINCFNENVPNPAEQSRLMSNRNFGVGSDGIILIMPSEVADFRMRMFNSDGSESEMCGNGIRCVGKYVRDMGLTDKDLVAVETLAGVKLLQLNVIDGITKSVTVDMGEPLLQKKATLTAHDRVFELVCVSMGNPHAVTFLSGSESVAGLDVERYGSVLETDAYFPNRSNIEFIELGAHKNSLKMRVWERGSGETLACGTGTCAAVVAAISEGICDMDADVDVELLGGVLSIKWSGKDNHVYMTGPAEFVFDGEWKGDILK